MLSVPTNVCKECPLCSPKFARSKDWARWWIPKEFVVCEVRTKTTSLSGCFLLPRQKVVSGAQFHLNMDGQIDVYSVWFNKCHPGPAKFSTKSCEHPSILLGPPNTLGFTRELRTNLSLSTEYSVHSTKCPPAWEKLRTKSFVIHWADLFCTPPNVLQIQRNCAQNRAHKIMRTSENSVLHQMSQTVHKICCLHLDRVCLIFPHTPRNFRQVLRNCAQNLQNNSWN